MCIVQGLGQGLLFSLTSVGIWRQDREILLKFILLYLKTLLYKSYLYPEIW